MRAAQRFYGAATAAILAATFLGGCGGSSSLPVVPAGGVAAGGAAGAAGGAVGSRTFVPNYVPDLLRLLNWQKSSFTVQLPGSGDPALIQAIQDGFTRWSLATNGTLQFHYGTAADSADIRISFVDKGTLVGGAVGLTRTFFSTGSGAINRAEMQLDSSLSPQLMTAAATHEMGHALGINGHSPERSDVMYYMLIGAGQVTDRDLNTLKTAFAWLFQNRSRRVAAPADSDSETAASATAASAIASSPTPCENPHVKTNACRLWHTEF